eukprot:3693764-Pleurochrysis_carterae.AAC.1
MLCTTRIITRIARAPKRRAAAARRRARQQGVAEALRPRPFIAGIHTQQSRLHRNRQRRTAQLLHNSVIGDERSTTRQPAVTVAIASWTLLLFCSDGIHFERRRKSSFATYEYTAPQFRLIAALRQAQRLLMISDEELHRILGQVPNADASQQRDFAAKLSKVAAKAEGEKLATNSPSSRHGVANSNLLVCKVSEAGGSARADDVLVLLGREAKHFVG